MEKYIQLVQELYTEPKDEEILGSFLQVETGGANNDVARVTRSESEPKKKKRQSEVQTKDIRNFFDRNNNQRTHPDQSDQTSKEKIIVLE